MTITTNIKAQDIEKVLNADSVSKAFLNKMLESPIELNGQLSARAMLYSGSSKNEPFTYLFNGNMNIKYMEYNLPISFTYTNKGLKYAASSPLKFNRFNLSPRYKWVRLYLGSSSMSFSPYTLGGAQFKGIGADLTPKGPLTGSIMYGKFYDAVEYNPETPYMKPVFKRTGYAFKLAFNKEKLQMETSLINALDDRNSISLAADTSFQLPALQNVALNFKSRINPVKGVNFDVEYASSAVNYKLLYKKETFFDLLFDKEAGVSRYKAYKVNVDFNPGTFVFGAGIEHIDPDYATLGAYYSRNDFQNITLNVSGSLFKNKLNFTANGGVENDNLKNQKQRKSTRSVGSASINWMPTEKMNLNATYSNFQSFSNIKNQFDYINQETPFDNLDTLNYLQVNQNATASIIYKLKATKEENKVLRLIFNLNQTAGEQGGESNAGNRFFTMNGNFTSGNPKTKKSLAAGVNSSISFTGENSRVIWGPVVSWSRPFIDELLLANLSVAYNQTHNNGEFAQSNFNLRGAVDYTYREMHKFKIELSVLLKKFTGKEMVSDCRLTLSYALVFKKKEILLRQIKEVVDPKLNR
jgi:hypothetical protein